MVVFLLSEEEMLENDGSWGKRVEVQVVLARGRCVRGVTC